MDDRALIAELESWLKTPWVHGQCLKGVGVDCVRFVCAIGRLAGWVPGDYVVPTYDQDWALHNTASMIEAEVCKFADQVFHPYQIGDIFLFIYGKCASHAGIYIGDNRMIHSYRGMGVVRSGLNYYWPYFHSAWRPRGIQ